MVGARYFQIAVERQPRLPDWEAVTRDMPRKDIQTLEQYHRDSLATAAQRVAQDLGVKSVRYPATYPLESWVGITFNITPTRGECDYASDDNGHYFTIPVDDFDASKLDRLKARLKWNPPYEVDVGGVSHGLKTGTMHLRVSVVVGDEKETWVYRGTGTYKELKRQGLVRKEGNSYVPFLSDIALSEYAERTTKTKGFLGFGRQEKREMVYEAIMRTTEPAKTNIGVSADGSVHVDRNFLQNEDVQRALDVIVEELFGLDLKLKVPVA